MEQFLLGTAVTVVGGLITAGIVPLARRFYRPYRSDVVRRSSSCSTALGRDVIGSQDSVDLLAEYGARKLLHRALRREIERRDLKA